VFYERVFVLDHEKAAQNEESKKKQSSSFKRRKLDCWQGGRNSRARKVEITKRRQIGSGEAAMGSRESSSKTAKKKFNRKKPTLEVASSYSKPQLLLWMMRTMKTKTKATTTTTRPR